MLDDLFEEVEGYLEAVNRGKQSTAMVYNYIEKVQVQINAAQSVLSSYYTDDYVQGIITFAKKRVKKYAKEAFALELTSALARNKEFDYQIYKDSLMRVARDDSLIRIITTGARFTTRATIMIDMNRVAGSLADWATGITKAREALSGKIRPRNYDPVRASEYWREKVYKAKESSSRYQRTIQLRLVYATTPAPFWQILDQGTTRLDSDRGGTAYPLNRPTNFVRSVQKELETFFAEIMDDEENYYYERTGNLQAEIDMAYSYITSLRKLVEEPEIYYDPIDYEWAEMMEREFSHYKGRVDELKLDKIVKDIQAGNEIPLTKAGRIEMTARGSKYRVRPYYSRLLRIAGK